MPEALESTLAPIVLSGGHSQAVGVG